MALLVIRKCPECSHNGYKEYTPCSSCGYQEMVPKAHFQIEFAKPKMNFTTRLYNSISLRLNPLRWRRIEFECEWCDHSTLKLTFLRGEVPPFTQYRLGTWKCPECDNSYMHYVITARKMKQRRAIQERNLERKKEENEPTLLFGFSAWALATMAQSAEMVRPLHGTRYAILKELPHGKTHLAKWDGDHYELTDTENVLHGHRLNEEQKELVRELCDGLGPWSDPVI